VVERDRFPPRRAFRFLEKRLGLGAPGANGDAPDGEDAEEEAVVAITAPDPGGESAVPPQNLGDPT
jgi:hypothetical protein